MPTVLITGANRGIGLELVRQYADDGWAVVATVRDLDDADALRAAAADLRLLQLDLRDFPAIGRLRETLEDEPIDLLIANAGTWGPMAIDGAADADGWIEALAVNAVAPTLLARTLLPNVAAAQGRMAAITSRMGSIADNSSGGYVAYRSSKAALNAAWKSLAMEAAGEGVVAAVLHPGWVRTRMGGGAAPLAPEDSVADLRRVIAGLGPADAGGFFDHDGQTIPW